MLCTKCIRCVRGYTVSHLLVLFITLTLATYISLGLYKDLSEEIQLKQMPVVEPNVKLDSQGGCKRLCLC